MLVCPPPACTKRIGYGCRIFFGTQTSTYIAPRILSLPGSPTHLPPTSKWPCRPIFSVENVGMEVNGTETAAVFWLQTWRLARRMDESVKIIAIEVDFFFIRFSSDYGC